MKHTSQTNAHLAHLLESILHQRRQSIENARKTKTASALWKLMNPIEEYQDLANRFYSLFTPAPLRDEFDRDFKNIIAYFQKAGIIDVQKKDSNGTL